MKDQVQIDDFTKLDIRVGEILSATDVPGSEKLVELKVFFGEEIGEKTIFAGIRKWYSLESLVGRKLIFVVNLAPKKFKIGDQEFESQGMLVAGGQDEAVLYTFDKDVPNGSKLR